MRKLIVFNSISLDGYFTDSKSDMSWAHAGSDDPEFAAFTSGNASGGGVMLFGRVTYDLMASYWPAPIAAQQNPVVAEQMNKLQKLVFSRTLTAVSWNNTKLVKGDLVTEVRRLKQAPGPGIVIMGSGTIVAQLTEAGGLIDEYQMVICPIVLGTGRTMFEGVTRKVPLSLKTSRTFKNGKVFACYQPAG